MQPIHAVLILNAQTQADLDAWCREERHDSSRDARHASSSMSASPSTAHDRRHGREQFGFFDGVAQPQIEGIKGNGVRTGEFILGYENEYGFFPVSPVVPAAADPQRILPVSANPYHKPARYRDLGFNGSFVVYRKLAQDVASLLAVSQERVHAARRRCEPTVYGLAGGKDGGALALAARRWSSRRMLTGPSCVRTIFSMPRADPNGLACPFGSHIRRTNPRDQIGPSRVRPNPCTCRSGIASCGGENRMGRRCSTRRC